MPIFFVSPPLRFKQATTTRKMLKTLPDRKIIVIDSSAFGEELRCTRPSLSRNAANRRWRIKLRLMPIISPSMICFMQTSYKHSTMFNDRSLKPLLHVVMRDIFPPKVRRSRATPWCYEASAAGVTEMTSSSAYGSHRRCCADLIKGHFGYSFLINHVDPAARGLS